MKQYDSLCEHILDYISNRCNSDEDLSKAGRECGTCYRDGLLTDEEYQQIIKAGKECRNRLEAAREAKQRTA